MKYCDKCNKTFDDDVKFCPECGNKLLSKDVCPECGAPVDASAKFCPSCGHKLVREKVCPQCGAHLEGDAKFCSKCGAKIDEGGFIKSEAKVENKNVVEPVTNVTNVNKILNLSFIFTSFIVLILLIVGSFGDVACAKDAMGRTLNSETIDYMFGGAFRNISSSNSNGMIIAETIIEYVFYYLGLIGMFTFLGFSVFKNIKSAIAGANKKPDFKFFALAITSYVPYMCLIYMRYNLKMSIGNTFIRTQPGWGVGMLFGAMIAGLSLMFLYELFVAIFERKNIASTLLRGFVTIALPIIAVTALASVASANGYTYGVFYNGTMCSNGAINYYTSGTGSNLKGGAAIVSYVFGMVSWGFLFVSTYLAVAFKKGVFAIPLMIISGGLTLASGILSASFFQDMFSKQYGGVTLSGFGAGPSAVVTLVFVILMSTAIIVERILAKRQKA